jgi:hypothetical protein
VSDGGGDAGLIDGDEYLVAGTTVCQRRRSLEGLRQPVEGRAACLAGNIV